MKKFLLSIATVFSIGAAQAQIFLNEVYVQPSVNHHEFIELFNAGTTPASSGCYTIITYFNDGTDYGFYVIDLPDVKIAARSYLLASSEGTFNYQNGQAVADVNWNLASNITRYVYTNGSLQVDNTGAPYYDIFTRAAAPGGSKKGPYAIFLYDGSTLVDGLL
ncbi:MAG TPA: hypothetical protein VFZ78_11605, partial [Flavisolibacter sp.]